MVLRPWRLDLHVDSEMMNLGIKPGVTTCTTLINAVTKTFSIDEALKRLQEMKRHRMLP
jgi:pentatricopeptide repeat protein